MNEELLQRLEREAEKITLDMPASLDDREFTAVFNAEFARLIVSECVRYFNEDYQRDFDALWREDLSKGMKEHFGVE